MGQDKRWIQQIVAIFWGKLIIMLSNNKHIDYLECTSYSKDNPQGYDDVPVFHKDVWPLIENNIKAIETIYVFEPTEEEPMIYKRDIIDSLYPEQLEHIAHRSYYGGHLDVYYKTNSISLIYRLINLWQHPCILKSTAEALKIDNYKIFFIRNVISEMAETSALFGFGHDGDPLYLFGHKNTLDTFIKEIEE